MKPISSLIGIILIAVALQLAWPPPAAATKAISEQTASACTVCHDKPGSKLMTDKGKYFELMRSFEGYEGLQASFGKCTGCHVREPGSTELTATGEKYRGVIEEMDADELRQWLMKPHPVASEDDKDAADKGR